MYVLIIDSFCVQEASQIVKMDGGAGIASNQFVAWATMKNGDEMEEIVHTQVVGNIFMMTC